MKNIKLLDSSPQRSCLHEHCYHVPSIKLSRFYSYSIKGCCWIFPPISQRCQLLQISRLWALGSLAGLLACFFHINRHHSTIFCRTFRPEHDLHSLSCKNCINMKGNREKNKATFKLKAARFKWIKSKQKENTKTTEVVLKWWQILTCNAFKLSPLWKVLTLCKFCPSAQGTADERAVDCLFSSSLSCSLNTF